MLFFSLVCEYPSLSPPDVVAGRLASRESTYAGYNRYFQEDNVEDASLPSCVQIMKQTKILLATEILQTPPPWPSGKSTKLL